MARNQRPNKRRVALAARLPVFRLSAVPNQALQQTAGHDSFLRPIAHRCPAAAEQGRYDDSQQPALRLLTRPIVALRPSQPFQHGFQQLVADHHGQEDDTQPSQRFRGPHPTRGCCLLADRMGSSHPPIRDRQHRESH